ncbi:MAG: 8-amino-7-oxononanoate synthase [Myxococcales bacterium]
MGIADRIAREELAALSAQGLLRSLETQTSRPGAEIALASGERLINFSSNDYLGLAGHPVVGKALERAAAAWGSGASASRLVCGDFAPHRELENALARFEGGEAAALFGSGYAANCGLVPVFAGREDVVVSDALNHASLVDGCRLSRARVEVYEHRDVDALAQALRRARGARRILVTTDSVFSMDGDVAPLREIAEACEREGAILAVDEAHATGVLGPRGAGLVAELGLEKSVDLRMGTLSKAVGVHGAYVVCSQPCRDLLVNRARSLVFSTALPPAIAEAALVALALLSGEEGEARRAKLRRSIARVAAALRKLGFPASEETPIFPIVVGAPEAALRAAAMLREKGLYVRPIRPPTVPEGTSRLRIALSAAHEEEHVERLLAALRDL